MKQQNSLSATQALPAGRSPPKNDYQQEQVLSAQISKRPYTNDKEEMLRTTFYKNLIKKDHDYYKGTDSLWNVPTRLSPKFCQYSTNSDKFNKSLRDIKKIEEKVQYEEQKNLHKKVIQQKSESQSRYLQRKLEREIIQYKSNQPMNQENVQELTQLEGEDPELFEELANKKRWSYITKDPTKAMKDQIVQKSQYWSLLNHMPLDKVNRIVTDKVLNFDKESCKMILEKILEEQKHEDKKRQAQQKDREDQLFKLKEVHNKTVELEEKCGINLGSMYKSEYSKIQTAGINKGVVFSPTTLKDLYSQEDTAEDHQNNNDNIVCGSKDIQQTLSPTTRQTQQLNSLQNSFLQSTRLYSSQSNHNNTQTDFKFKFASPKSYQRTTHIETLALSKPDYQSRDFFAKSEFRGLFLADHQESIGEKAYKCVEELNDKVLTKFKELNNFNESIKKSKTIRSYYKEVVIPSIKQSQMSRDMNQSMYDTASQQTSYTFGNTKRSISTSNKNQNFSQMYDAKFLRKEVYDYSKQVMDSFGQTQKVNTAKNTDRSHREEKQNLRSITSNKHKRNLSSFLQNNDGAIEITDGNNSANSYRNTLIGNPEKFSVFSKNPSTGYQKLPNNQRQFVKTAAIIKQRQLLNGDDQMTTTATAAADSLFDQDLSYHQIDLI